MGRIRKLDRKPALDKLSGIWRKTAIDNDYWDNIEIDRGGHPKGYQHCFMEGLALATGQAWGAHAVCVSGVITSTLINANDSLDDTERQELKVLARDILGTAPIMLKQMSLAEFWDEGDEHDEVEQLFGNDVRELWDRANGYAQPPTQEDRDALNERMIWVEVQDTENPDYIVVEKLRSAAIAERLNVHGEELRASQVIAAVRAAAAIMPAGVEVLEKDWITPKVRQEEFGPVIEHLPAEGDPIS